MPYLKAEVKESIDSGARPLTAGELNYAITSVIKAYVIDNGLAYRTINDILGALEGAKHEFYFRVAFPYEQVKMRQHGDVYEGVATGE